MHLIHFKDVQDNSIQIDGCACAVIACENGQLVYDYELLVIHFRDHVGMQDEEDPDCPLEAIEWIEYNIIRSIPYYRGMGIVPDIRHDGESIF